MLKIVSVRLTHGDICSSHLFIFIVPIVRLYYILLLHIPLDEHFGHFHFSFSFVLFQIMSLWNFFSRFLVYSIFLGFRDESGIARHRICLPASWQGTALKIYFLTTILCHPMSLPTLNIVRFLNFFQFNDCEVVQCPRSTGFNSHFFHY